MTEPKLKNDWQKGRHRNREAIHFLLGRVRSKVRTRLVIESLLWFFLILTTLLLFIFICILLVPAASSVVVALYGFWTLVVCATLGILFGFVGLITIKPSLYEIAHILQISCSQLRNDVVAALQFSEESQTFDHVSEAIASEHVERTASKLHSIHNEDSLFSLIPQRPLFAPFWGTLAAIAITFGVYTFAEEKADDIFISLLKEKK